MEQEKKIGIWAILAPLATELGHDGIDWLIAKLTAHKENLAATEPCPQGYHRNTQGVCVPDVGGK